MANDLYLDYSVGCTVKDGKIVAFNGDVLPTDSSVVPKGATHFIVDVYRRDSHTATYVGRKTHQEPFFPR